MFEYLTWFYVASITLLVVWIIGRWQRKSTLWQRLGVPGPKPVFLLGNMLDRSRYSFPDLEMKWMREYGKVYGWYIGTQPFLTVIDHELVKQVLIKDFPSFMNRQSLNISHELLNQNLLFSESENWKRGRTITTPAFTSGKLRLMAPLMNRCIDKLINFLDSSIEKKGGVIETKKVIAGLTMDVIAITSFATETNTNDDRSQENTFLKHGLELLKIPPLRGFCVFFFPLAINNLLNVRTLASPEHFNYFIDLTREIAKQRKTQTNPKNDFLQLMIDAEAEESTLASSNFDKLTATVEEDLKDDKSFKSSSTKVKKLTENEIIANSIFFLIAGFETTSSTISHTLYELALNPEIQEKLYDELNEALDGCEPNSLEYHDKVNGQIPYFEAIIKETLRLFPPVTQLNRRLVVDNYKLGTIPLVKDQVVIIPPHAIHRCPDYYPEPDKFDPERFMPENKHLLKPYTYLPFGLGPRNCVGMRFAYQEMKLTLARLVQKYRFELLPHTPRELKFDRTTPLLRTSPFDLKISKRH